MSPKDLHHPKPELAESDVLPLLINTARLIEELDELDVDGSA